MSTTIFFKICFYGNIPNKVVKSNFFGNGLKSPYNFEAHTFDYVNTDCMYMLTNHKCPKQVFGFEENLKETGYTPSGTPEVRKLKK